MSVMSVLERRKAKKRVHVFSGSSEVDHSAPVHGRSSGRGEDLQLWDIADKCRGHNFEVGVDPTLGIKYISYDSNVHVEYKIFQIHRLHLSILAGLRDGATLHPQWYEQPW